MKLKVGLILLVSVFFFSFIEEKSTKIDGSNLNQDLLEQLILVKVNKLRKKKSQSLLEINPLLRLPAQDQANYLKKKGSLSHRQISRNKKTPLDRAEYFGGKFRYVGENLAYTYLNESVEGVKNKKNSIVLKDYETTAEYFFQLWKNSKDHYVNLIDKDFNLTGIRFSYVKKTNRIYGVQVFGSL